ncbi:MAG: type II secretion system protein [Verrucomicrobia bacterium]|nr:type II secretion system protein [Verrucomicrobiota bacterium]
MKLKSVKNRSFTLIELLVVVAIISLLAAMLLPALKNAKRSARKTWGMNNLRQMGLAVNLYRDDYNGRTPNNGVWPSVSTGLLVPYIGSNLIYGTKARSPCPDYYYTPLPSNPTEVTACNINLMGGRGPTDAAAYSIEDVRNPSTTFLLAQGADAWAT